MQTNSGRRYIVSIAVLLALMFLVGALQFSDIYTAPAVETDPSGLDEEVWDNPGTKVAMTADEAIEWIEDKRVSFIYLWHPDCIYCQQADPVIDRLVEEHEMYLAVVDISQTGNRWLPTQLGTTSVPTVWGFLGTQRISPPITGFPGADYYEQAFQTILDFADEYYRDET